MVASLVTNSRATSYPFPFTFPRTAVSGEIISQDSQNGSICSSFQLKAKLEMEKKPFSNNQREAIYVNCSCLTQDSDTGNWKCQLQSFCIKFPTHKAQLAPGTPAIP